MNRHAKALLDALGKLSAAQGWLLCATLSDELHHLFSELMGPVRSRLAVQQAWQALLGEGGLRLIERLSRQSKRRGATLHGRPLRTRAAQHLVLDLNDIPSVEERPLLKKRIHNLLGVRVKGALLAQC